MSVTTNADCKHLRVDVIDKVFTDRETESGKGGEKLAWHI